MYCKNCGKSIIEDSSYCKYCGNEINKDPNKKADGQEDIRYPPNSNGDKIKSSAGNIFGNIAGYVIGFIAVSAIITLLTGGFKSQNEVGLSTEYKTNFIQNCTTNGGNFSYCNCCLSYLERNYTPDYLYSIETNNNQAAMTDVITKAVNYCTSE